MQTRPHAQPWAHTIISRLRGGIHYRAAIEYGLDQGQCVGERGLSLTFKQ